MSSHFNENRQQNQKQASKQTNKQAKNKRKQDKRNKREEKKTKTVQFSRYQKGKAFSREWMRNRIDCTETGQAKVQKIGMSVRQIH